MAAWDTGQRLADVVTACIAGKPFVVFVPVLNQRMACLHHCFAYQPRVVLLARVLQHLPASCPDLRPRLRSGCPMQARAH